MSWASGYSGFGAVYYANNVFIVGGYRAYVDTQGYQAHLYQPHEKFIGTFTSEKDARQAVEAAYAETKDKPCRQINMA